MPDFLVGKYFALSQAARIFSTWSKKCLHKPPSVPDSLSLHVAVSVTSCVFSHQFSPHPNHFLDLRYSGFVFLCSEELSVSDSWFVLVAVSCAIPQLPVRLPLCHKRCPFLPCCLSGCLTSSVPHALSSAMLLLKCFFHPFSTAVFCSQFVRLLSPSPQNCSFQLCWDFGGVKSYADDWRFGLFLGKLWPSFVAEW